jgi:uncharacterized membrane protein (UPF0127 family)
MTPGPPHASEHQGEASKTQPARPRFAWWMAAAGAVALVVVGAVVLGANYPDDPTLGPSPDGSETARQRSGVHGFGEVAFTVRSGQEGYAREYCALLAETSAQHARGLMGRRDLGGYDAMVFRFDSDSRGPFYMRNVPIPLTVAWFDSSGRFVSHQDMAPCGNQDDCPRYFPTRAYRFALEVPEGGLARLGVGPGSVLSVGGACARR